MSGQEPGDTASYRCFAGFILEGVTLRTCQTTGVWSFDPPICVGEPHFFKCIILTAT